MPAPALNTPTYHSSAQENMIDGQLTPNGIISDAILAAIEAVPREQFVPSELSASAYIDSPLPLSHGRYMLPVMPLAKMLEPLALAKRESVLSVAGVTGYSSAILSSLFARVTMVEEQGEFASKARAQLSLLKLSNVEVLCCPLAQGCPDHGPYDAILVEGAVGYVPDHLFEQLNDGGIMVLAQQITQRPGSISGLCRIVIATRRGERIETRMSEDISVPLLPGFESEAGFSFE